MSQPHPDGGPPITAAEHALRETRRAQAERARIDAARYARELATHRSLSRGYTPAYGFIPADTNAWTVLAIASNGGGQAPYPYLLARRYGRGLVVVGGDHIPAGVPEMLDNFLRWNRRMCETLPEGELRLE